MTATEMMEKLNEYLTNSTPEQLRAELLKGNRPYYQTVMTFQEKIQKFAETITTQQLARHATDGLTYPGHETAAQASIKPGKKYTKVDVGTSGKYMVDNATEEIFGIKAYGVIHRGHQYGNLDSIDDWNWGGYYTTRKVK